MRVLCCFYCGDKRFQTTLRLPGRLKIDYIVVKFIVESIKSNTKYNKTSLPYGDFTLPVYTQKLVFNIDISQIDQCLFHISDCLIIIFYHQ